MSISNTHEFIELEHKDSHNKVIVEEFSDFYFDHGYRFSRYVPNHEVDYPSVIEKAERLSLWLLKNSSFDPYKYLDYSEDTSGTSEGFFFEAPEIY